MLRSSKLSRHGNCPKRALEKINEFSQNSEFIEKI